MRPYSAHAKVEGTQEHLAMYPRQFALHSLGDGGSLRRRYAEHAGAATPRVQDGRVGPFQVHNLASGVPPVQTGSLMLVSSAGGGAGSGGVDSSLRSGCEMRPPA